MKQLCGIALLLAFCLVSCNKDKDKSKAELVVGTWKTTSYTVDPGYDTDGDGELETDFFTSEEECVKDDLVKFMAGGTGLYDEGPTKCFSDDPQSDNLSWSLSIDEKTLTIEGENYTVLQLDDKTMKISSTDPTGNDDGGPLTETITLARQ